MTLHDLSSSSDLQRFLSSHSHCVICFSAIWCGPCKASKPELEALASQLAMDPSISVSFAIVYEHVLGEELSNYRIRAFPTYVLFVASVEVGRVEGVNFHGIRELIDGHCKTKFVGEGKLLSGGQPEVTLAEARAQRLARLEEVTNDRPSSDVHTIGEEDDRKAGQPADATDDRQMVDPTETLHQDDIDTLTNSMGFSRIRALKGLIHGNGTVEGAVEWLLVHQEDADIDDPVEFVPKETSPVTGAVAQSYKCNECGKILSNMANLELHANKTGHSDFEESTELKKPLTEEEKKAKIEEIKSLLKVKRMEREHIEREDTIDREKQRRFMGKEMSKTREQMEIEARKRQAQLKKKEKDAALRERERIRAELEKDKRERAANKGKLSSKLGIEGYNPDAIQYDIPVDKVPLDSTEMLESKKPKKVQPSAAQMDEYISKVSSYRAGGDGGNCLKILKVYISNVLDHPEDEKFKKINMENKAYKTKVKPFLGAKNLLMSVGFHQSEDGTNLELSDDVDMQVLQQAKEKLEVALNTYLK